MPVDARVLDEVIDALRLGAVITIGGSRAHSIYGFDTRQGWYREDFDEGALTVSRSSEADVRALARRDPTACRVPLHTGRWRAFRDALDRDDRPAARAALAHWQALGDPLDDAPILAAWLAPDAGPLDPDTADRIRARLRSGTLWHLFMETVGWSRAPGTGARGAAFLDTLLARLDEPPPQAEALRRAFLDLDGGDDDGRGNGATPAHRNDNTPSPEQR